MNKILPILILLLFLNNNSIFAQDENYKYIINSQSLLGYTGNIVTVSPYITDYKKFSFGLHRFNVGVNYGFSKNIEAGISLDLNELSPITNDTFENKTSTIAAFHIKYNVLRQGYDEQPFDFSFGTHRKTLYFVCGRQFDTLFNSVIGSGVDINFSSQDKISYFMSFSFPAKYSSVIIDYKSSMGQVNFGLRSLLSEDVKLDLFLTDVQNVKNVFNNFVFGLTLTN
ncbi:MAG: hypothetical protein A2252_02585 [Elusimicrobia bacterium RIFOXYA2_FULL_39_19]|nr:MAG: hypothetical protein A2252_02585 [Elusimicrobia bacterium RIFOXYA2_FULL_39_19]